MRQRPSLLLLTIAGYGYAFLYLPIAVLVIYSFNSSPRIAVWGGFSPRWYVALFDDRQIIEAAILSLKIAALSATVATLLGLSAALALGRAVRFRGRTFFTFMLGAPLVMPDVVIGLALLLFFVALSHLPGWPVQRGFATISIAHVTLSIAYVAVIVRARIGRLDPSLEEAARDLGATDWRVFRRVTLPLLAPALLSGWLLAFTLSLDDLVIASFTSGPGASTLPMVIFSRVRLGLSPEVNALASLLILFVTIAVILSLVVGARRRGRTSGP